MIFKLNLLNSKKRLLISKISINLYNHKIGKYFLKKELQNQCLINMNIEFKKLWNNQHFYKLNSSKIRRLVKSKLLD